MVKEMDENDKNAPEEQTSSSSEKKLKLDLSEAITSDFDDDDDIIELKDEIALPPEKEESEIDLDELPAADSTEEQPEEKPELELKTFDLETEALENELNQLDELTFEEEDESEEEERLEEESLEDESLDIEQIKPLVDETPVETSGSDDVAERLEDERFEDESLDIEQVQPVVDEVSAETSSSDDVIEITEFDDILSDDVNEMVTLADESEAIDSEEEFLELIEVEEDSIPEKANEIHAEIEDEIIQFDGIRAEVEDVELEDFINESINEEIQIDDELEDELANSLGVDAGSEMSLTDEAPRDEDLDFNIDSKEISERIDQVDTIFFDESTSQADLTDEPPSDAGLFEDIVSDSVDAEPVEDIVSDSVDAQPEIEDVDQPMPDTEIPEELPSAAGLANLAPEQIEESIARVIQQNFSGKIESMVAEAIEKAVSKEIDRLKNILMDDDTNELS